MHKHDWVTGLLGEIERYCADNKLDELKIAVSNAIDVAIVLIEKDINENVIYLSHYRDRRVLLDAERILLAFSTSIDASP